MIDKKSSSNNLLEIYTKDMRILRFRFSYEKYPEIEELYTRLYRYPERKADLYVFQYASFHLS